MTLDDDWRLNGQETFLTGVVLVRRPYRRSPRNPEWDHDHCAFCSAKFTLQDIPDALHEGYTTVDDYHWVCDDCFNDFRHRFRWLVETPTDP